MMLQRKALHGWGVGETGGNYMAGFVRRINVPLPSLAEIPMGKQMGLKRDLSNLPEDTQVEVFSGYNAVKQTCKTIVAEWCEHCTGEAPRFLVWPGPKQDNAKGMCFVAKLTREQADEYDSQRYGVVIRARNEAGEVAEGGIDVRRSA